MNNDHNSHHLPASGELQHLLNDMFVASSTPLGNAANTNFSNLKSGNLPAESLSDGFPEAIDGISQNSHVEQPFFPVHFANDVVRALPSPAELRKRASETRRFVETNFEELIHKIPSFSIAPNVESLYADGFYDHFQLQGHNFSINKHDAPANGHLIPAEITPGTAQFYFVQNNETLGNTHPNETKEKLYDSKRNSFDPETIKRDFPILSEIINGKPLVWLDNGATTQKPKAVIERISHYYCHENSNVHRAAHELAARSTDAFEKARKTVQTFINARSPNEIVFVRGTTEGINLVAKSWGDDNLQEGDEIVLSQLEHHANIVPWQQLAVKRGLKIKVMPVDDEGQIILTEYAKLLTVKTKLVAFTQVSNALGTITPAKQIISMARQVGAKTLVDGAQSVAHMQTDVADLDADWFVFSGHKLFGPTGIGVLYGKEQILNSMIPWQGGGGMIKDVTFEYTQYQNAPMRFEAGTGNIADAVGLGAAIEYISQIGMSKINRYEHELLTYATRQLKNIPGLRIIGNAANKASVLSFVLEGFSSEQVSLALNKEGIAVRAGHHCAQPILRRFGLENTVRASLAFYNTHNDIDRLFNSLRDLKDTGL